MNYSMQLNIPQAFAGLTVRANRSHQAGLRRVALHVQQIAVRKVAEIRKRPVPTRRQIALFNRVKHVRTGRKQRAITASDAPAWKPTGELLRAVQAEPIFKRDAVILTADVPHSGPRHELGVSRIPKAPAMGIVRRDPFFTDAARISAGQAGPLYVDGYEAEWGRGT